MREILKYGVLVFALLLNLSIVSAVNNANESVLDFKNWDGNSILTLDGEWRFFWQEFISVETDTTLTNFSNSIIVEVPSYWTEYSINDEELPGIGFGTYALTIMLPSDLLNKDLALNVPIFDDSYALFLNKEKVSWNGIPGMNSENAEPGYVPKLIVFQPQTEKLEILIHVSNFEHRRGGFWKSIRIGEAEKMLRQKSTYELIVHVTLGLLLSFFLFFLFFFLLYPKNKPSLYLALTLFGIALRLISTDTFPILIFSYLPWDWLIRLEYLGTFIAFVFASWYFLDIYPGKNIKIIIKLHTVIMSLLSLFVIVLEPRDFAYTMYYFKPTVLIFFTYYLILSFLYIFKRNKADEFYFAAFLIFLIALVNDIRVSDSASGIFNDYTIHFALQVFVFTHVILMINSWITAYKEKESLNFEVEYLNLHLEKRIEERTKEQEIDRLEIKKQNKEIEEKNNELKLRMEFSNKIQSVMAHDLRSPITSLFQISDYLYLSYGEGELKETIGSIRELSGSASSLLDNLLFWARSQQEEINYSPQWVKIQDLISEMLSLYKVALRQKFVSTDKLIAEDIEAFCDPHLLKIVLRNLFSNALKFSKKKGNITITATETKASGEVVLVIEDKGIGIPLEMLKILNNPVVSEDVEVRKGTSNEGGSGLGIRLSHELLEINKGRMKIESSQKGTKVLVFLPGT